MSGPTKGDAWEGESFAQAWQKQQAMRDLTFAAPTAKMLEEARLAPGGRVLDLGTGSGDTAAAAAARVGPTGSVVGTDASIKMIDAATTSVTLPNVTFRTMDAQAIDLPAGSFDAVIGRLVLMFLDLQRTLTGVRSVLRPGGRFASVVWGPLDSSPFHKILLDAVRAEGGWGDRPPQAAIALANPDPAIYTRALTAAGFTDVALHEVPIVRPFPSAAAAFAFVQQAAVQAEPVMRLPEEARPRAWARIEREFKAMEKDGACNFPALTYVCSGTR